jgi:hypothetical protein
MLRSLTLLTVLAVTSLARAQPAETSPSKLLLRIEGFLGASYWVELVPDSSSVRFTTAEGTKEEKIDIPNERWSIFWKRLEEANVWSWKKQYRDPNTVDGTVWTVTIDWSGRKVGSSGSNAYPDIKQFEIFKAGVSELLGGRKFE